jgi:hypothetical protein
MVKWEEGVGGGGGRQGRVAKGGTTHVERLSTGCGLEWARGQYTRHVKVPPRQ